MGGAASVSGCKVEALNSKSAEEVAQIIADLGEAYVGYSRLFYSNGISGEVVLGLIVSGDASEIDSYFEELGVKSKLHRRVITSAFYKATDISAAAPGTTGEVAAAPHAESPVQLLPRVPTAQELRVVIEPDVERILDTMPPIECEWRCKAHSSLAHDVFINYRVVCDKEFASTLYFGLSSLRVKLSHDGSAIRPFLDQVCLCDGENWEQGFLNGLRSSALIVLLISEAAIEGIRKANNKPDNVLLEYECALELQKTNNVAILPLLIGQYVKVDGQELFRKFNGFDCNVYPDERHCHPRSQRARRAVSVRATMKELFSLQGIQVDPRNMGAVLAAVEHRFTQAKQDSVLRSHFAWKQKRADERRGRLDNRLPTKILPADYLAKKAQNEASRGDTDDNLSLKFVEIIQNSQNVKDLKKLYASGKVDVDFPGAYGYSGLHFCAYYNYPEVAKYLLSLGADCDKVETYSSQTPLQQAKGCGHQKMVEILKPYSTEETANENECNVSLNNAAGDGNVAEVVRLLQKGADPDFLNPAYYHYGALHRAIYNATDGAPQVVSVLLEYGADGSLKEGYGQQTPMQFAQSYNKPAPVEILKFFRYTE